jgi:hypothetical protein
LYAARVDLRALVEAAVLTRWLEEIRSYVPDCGRRKITERQTVVPVSGLVFWTRSR